MTYQETIAYLYASQPAFHLVGSSAYKPGLGNTYRLMAHLGNPHTQLRAVHVAGTNGKGSTSHLIAAALQAEGYKVGLFTSPHLVDFRERIRISGVMIPEAEVVGFVEEHRSFLDEISPSFFETTMAMAFGYFAKEKVDIAVVEVGLGGRLDSTNILHPILSVITNIGIDHTEFLGTTLSQIANEKAGIMKEGVPCVIGETELETQPIFLERARECGILGSGLETTDCRLWMADQCGYMRKRRKKEVVACQLKGYYQDKNQQTAYVALQVLRNYCGVEISTNAIADGFANVCDLTGLRGRWELLGDGPLMICDTGHNGHGMRYVTEQLVALMATQCEEYLHARLHIVVGMVGDKDIDTVLNILPEDAIYYFTQPSNARALPAKELQARWQVIHSQAGNSEWYESVAEAVRSARERATKEDIIFVGGSNYVVGELLRIDSVDS